MQNKFNELREKHPVFTFDKYEIINYSEKVVLRYYFSVGDFVTYTPKWEFLKKHTEINYEQEEIIHKLAFNLGLVELISYWKTTCSPTVIINAGYINEEQINWWKMQYFLGLGEFFYTNKIDASLDDFMKIEVTGNSVGEQCNRTEHDKSGCLIPVGGGKDSIVTLELLSDKKRNNLCYLVNYKDTSIKCARTAGYTDEEIIIANRSLDGNMLALNKEGYLNGHTPFSAIVAFSSVLTAYLFDKEYVVLSNEASANESTVEGTLINHQYSKSYKFERDFIDYEKEYINSGVHYFSLLRPFSELQIARFFAKNRKYFDVFKSCNVGSKLDIWCCSCPKCLFVYIILSPFIKPELLENIFGKDLLNDVSLIPIFDKLIGIAPEKPFECVGTCDEVNTAICLALHKLESSKSTIPKLYYYYKEKELYDLYSSKNINLYGEFYNEEHSIPKELVDRVKNMMLQE